MWPDIGDEICRAVLQFFETGFIPEELLNTSLSLIPKVDTPNRAVDFRPIAYCSTLYKFVSKFLCSRLAKVLPFLVHPNQGAFIQGRSIAHNVLICQDIIKHYRRSSISPRCAIKVDISKAYDTIDWRFIEDLLKALCFPSRFIGWIMTWDLSSVKIIKSVMGEFSSVTGLQINESKSQVFYGGISAADECFCRMQLIHSVLFRLRNYWMSIFILPQSVIKEIERLCSGFLWGLNGNRCKIHMASWDKVYLPEAFGGLGFRNGQRRNHAILAKYIWAISEKHDVLWVINSQLLTYDNLLRFRVPLDSDSAQSVCTAFGGIAMAVYLIIVLGLLLLTVLCLLRLAVVSLWLFELLKSVFLVV
ncbi:uncharacterized protein LOC133815033 [Humulus lupulus]|uniref:uncharacterized protein LOC133815033 n=1 Tax=Humulus lupulus TaxID=3486 RepID=UPI002B413C1E|nr:uncharacterized protein LOC133815033 [Humulus lupulus]